MTDSTNIAMFLFIYLQCICSAGSLLKNLTIELCKLVVKVWTFSLEIRCGTKLTKSQTLHDPKKKGNIIRTVLLNAL